LSALDDAEGDAVNGAMVAARAEDKALAIRLLRSEGYDAVATSAIEILPDQPGRLRVTITVAPGNRYTGAIAMSGPDTVPPGMARGSGPDQRQPDPRRRCRGGGSQSSPICRSTAILPRARPA
jgi:translocation and assembly module TamA